MPDTETPILYRGGLQVTEQQAAIVDHVLRNRLTVVDAGAGSGKTRTTVAAVLEILDRRRDITIDKFILITFTNGAADELRRRMEEALQKRRDTTPPSEQSLWAEARERLNNAYIGTIHGFCRQILRTFGYGSLVARESDVELSKGLLYESITDAIEEAFESNPAHPFLAEIGTNWHSYELESIVREIYEHIRNRGLSAFQILELTRGQADDPGKPARVALADLVSETHRLYSDKKREDQKVDAADLLLYVARVLEDARETGVVAKIGRRYRYLFVDEFQDTDRVQMRIVDSLSPALDGVLLVGDEKQSIYHFRGGGMRLSEIARERGVTTLPLSISRRPTRQLLELQNALFRSISQNYRQLDQPLDPAEDAVEATSTLPAITYLHAGDADDIQLRIAATADKIRTLLTQHIDDKGSLRRINPGDIAVLFRANEKVDRYEDGLSSLLDAHGIQVRKEAGGQFFRRPEIIAAYRVLRLLVDYPNEIVLAQALRTPYLRVDASAIEYDILQSGRIRDNQLTDWFNEEHRAQADKFRDLRAAVRIDTVPELLERLYRAFEMREYHRERGEMRAVDNLERLREMARGLTHTEQSLTLRVFVQWLQVRLLHGFDEPDSQELADEEHRPPYVRVMTVHKAKGLEFPVVIIPEVQVRLNGFSSNMDFIINESTGLDVRLPLSTPSSSPNFTLLTARDNEADRNEAMRVFYVAVTRAKNAVMFVGSGIPAPPRQPDDRLYSWKDEIRRAWPSLAPLGARVESVS